MKTVTVNYTNDEAILIFSSCCYRKLNSTSSAVNITDSNYVNTTSMILVPTLEELEIVDTKTIRYRSSSSSSSKSDDNDQLLRNVNIINKKKGNHHHHHHRHHHRHHCHHCHHHYHYDQY